MKKKAYKPSLMCQVLKRTLENLDERHFHDWTFYSGQIGVFLGSETSSLYQCFSTGGLQKCVEMYLIVPTGVEKGAIVI